MRVTSKILLGAGLAVTLVGSATAWASSSGPTKHSAIATSQVSPSVSFDASTETKYVPVTPCRAVDTRRAGGPIAAGAARTFNISGTSAFPQQGGPAGGCGVPFAATAVQATFTAITTSGNGYLRAWPVGATEPSTTVLNYTKLFNASTGSRSK